MRPTRLRLAACCVVVLALGLARADVSVESLERRISLKNAWGKTIDTVTASSTKGPLDAFVACYPAHLAPRIALVKAVIKKERQEVTQLLDEPAGAPPGAACFRVAFKAPAKTGATVEFDLVATLTGVFKPNPSRVAQLDKQYVEYEDSMHLLLPYAVAKATTVVTLPTSDIKSHSESDKLDKAGAKLSYGPFAKLQPWASQELTVHFRHDKPFKRVNSLVREIEVSHWGNIYVEETYEIQNAGAEHKGKFSRHTYAHTPGGKGNSFPSVRAKLPGPADSLYYKDLIGNISSSDTTRTPSSTSVELRLRYPLMGGWKTDFTLGYSLPLAGFLYRRPKGKLRLLMDFSTSFEDVWVERLVTRVVLPEGAGHIKCTLPFEGVEQSFDKKYTYLDTAGRPVLVLTKSNVVPEHNKPFAVDYTFGAAAMMREPLLLIAVFAAFFAAVAVYNRLDFTITRDERWAQGQARERGLGLLQKLAALWDGEAEALEGIVSLAPRISDEPSIAAATRQRQELEARLRADDAAAKPLMASLEAVSGKMAAAAREHADRSKALAQRAAKLLDDKAGLIRRGAVPHEASERMAGPCSQALAAIRGWAAEGARMAAA